MLWNSRNLGVFVLLVLMACISCATWDALNANVPAYAPPEPIEDRDVPGQIRLVFYKKLQREPLTVTQRQQVEMANTKDTTPLEARMLKQRVWNSIRKTPLAGLSVQLVPEGTSDDVLGPMRTTNGQGIVSFTASDHVPNADEVRVDLSSHPFFQEVKDAVKDPYTSFLIRPHMGSGDEVESHVLLNWDGKVVVRIDGKMAIRANP